MLIPALLGGFHYRDRLAGPARAALAGMIVAPIVVFGAHSLSLARSNVVETREWDLQIFSVYGHAGASGGNFYTVDGIRAAAPERAYSRVFVEDTLATPFPYPPPTMFVMLPFGWWSMRTAASLWYVLNGVALAAAVVLLRRRFVPDGGALGLLLVTALVLTFRPTQSTIALGQWNFLALLTVLWFWRDRGRAVAGVWLAAAFLLRTCLILLLIDPIRRHAWRTVAVAGVTVAGLTVLAVAVFGATTCATYLDTLLIGFPAPVYTEAINQSLLTAVLRVTGFDPAHGSPLTEPVFLAAAAMLTAVTGWLLWRLPAEAEWTPGLVVALALLLYPASVEHFSMLLLPAVLSVWQYARRVDGGGGGRWGVVCVALVYTLIGVDDGHRAFFGLALTWAALVGIGCAELAARGHDGAREAPAR